MKKVIIVNLMLLLLLSFGCKAAKEKAKLPDESIKAQVPIYSPLQSYKENYRLLQAIPAGSFAFLVPQTIYTAKETPVNSAFAFGVLAADASICAKARNKAQYTQVLNQMLKLMPQLAEDKKDKELAVAMKDVLKKDNWEEIEYFLDMLRKDMEDELWAGQKYELYTLLALGAWTRTVCDVSKLLLQDYKPEQTKALNHIGSWNSIATNYELFHTKDIRDSQTYRETALKVQRIRDIINDSAATYGKEQLQEIITTAELILKIYQ